MEVSREDVQSGLEGLIALQALWKAGYHVRAFKLKSTRCCELVWRGSVVCVKFGASQAQAINAALAWHATTRRAP